MDSTQRTIFVIDDDASVRKVLDTHLTKAGYGVIISSGTQDVFTRLEEDAYDLVICDFKMPDVEGIQIVEVVRQRSDTVQVVVLTGHDDVATAVEVMKKGAFDYLMKPIGKQDLLRTVQKALSHKSLLEKNKKLEQENREYQTSLEDKVRDRTRELDTKAEELREAFSKLKSVNIQFVKVLAETVESKDPHTEGHCARIRRLCAVMGRQMGLQPEEMELLDYASLLHDIGKVGVKGSILNKNGKLNDAEYEHVKQHSFIGERIIEGISLMGGAAKIVGAHHENYDGTGYPRGLKSEEIPLAARILAVADAFDAMNTDRPYRTALSKEAILKELKKVRGTQLDPEVVNLFISKEVYLTERR